MTNREAGINVIREMMGDQAAARLSASADSNTFGASIAAYAVDQVFADIWTRPGLDRRSRSLVSMSVMIAMRPRLRRRHSWYVPFAGPDSQDGCYIRRKLPIKLRRIEA
jgi:hypothetical protein